MKTDEATREIVDSGDTRVGGVPARYFEEVDNQHGAARKHILTYVLVKDKVVYRIILGGDDGDFQANEELFLAIRDSFSFRNRR